MSARRPARIGRYEVLDRLGIGGMGAVYLASDPLLGRTVAIKVLRSDDDELRERFAREARSAASLKHHHIVTIYDIGEDDEGRPFLAMEFIDGESMAELIRRRAPLALHQRIKYIIDLCAGLGYAHRTGIMHRDIKPANLMITGEGVLKIVDFGLARIVSSSAAGLTRAGTLLGTVHYMSPEQADGTVVDHLSDIFAVGLVLYEILTYRKAYPGDSAPVVLHNIVHTDPAPIGELLPERDEELEWIVSKAIQKKRPRRYQDLRDLASELEAVRARLEAEDRDATIVRRPDADDGFWRSASTSEAPGQTDVSPNALPPSPRPISAERHRRSLDVIAQRRAAQIAERLAAAVDHFAAGRYEDAVEQCEAAILINPDETRALQLLDQAHQALTDRQIQQWLAEARAHLAHGALTQADELVEQALQVRSDSEEAIALRDEVHHTRRERERAADRARAVGAAVDRARRNLQTGAFEAALRAANEALAYEPSQREASELRNQALAGLEARRLQQEHDQAAAKMAARARELAQVGNHSAALELLRGFRPPHAAVDEAIAEIEARVAEIERQRREEAERVRLRAAEEARRREQLAAVRATSSAALDRGDYTGARAAVQLARSQWVVPGDAELERVCTEIETAIDDAEATARRRASVERHLQSAHAAVLAGDLTAAAKSVDAVLSLAPDHGEARRLQRHVRELKNAAEAAAQQRASIERQIKAAHAALAKGDLEVATKYVDLALRLAPDEPNVLALHQQIQHAQEAKQRDERQRLERAQREREQREREQREQRERAQQERTQRDRERREREQRVQREREQHERAQREREQQERAQREREQREREQREREQREREQRERDQRDRETREREQREAAAQAAAQAEKGILPSPELPGAIDDGAGDLAEAQVFAGARIRTRVVAGIAAVIVLGLAVGGGWWVLGDRPDDAPSPVPPTPVPVSYANELALAREQYRSGDLAGAVRQALTIPTDAQESNEVTALLRDIRGEAQGRAQTARQSAERGGQSNASPFSEAAAKDAEAANLTQPQDLERVVSLYEEAAALYRKAATAGASIDELMQLARAEVKANRIRLAVGYALQVLETNPRHADALRLLRTTREQGQKLAQTAAAEARRAGLSIENSPAFKAAVAEQAAAAQLTGPQETARAYDTFLSAAARYRGASEQFQADNARRLADARRARELAEQRLQAGDVEGAAAAIQQAERLEPNAQSMPALRKRLADARASKPSALPSTEIEQALAAARDVSDDPEALTLLADLATRYPNDPRVDAAIRARRQARDNKIADLLRRAQPAADAQAIELLDEALRLDPSRQDLHTERDRRRAVVTTGRVEQELRTVMTRLEAAYESGNVAEIVRLAPVMDRARLEAQFKSVSIRWDVEPCTARIDPNATTATLTCVIHETAQPAGIRARVQPTTQTRQFVLTNVNGTWRITAQQIQ